MKIAFLVLYSLQKSVQRCDLSNVMVRWLTTNLTKWLIFVDNGEQMTVRLKEAPCLQLQQQCVSQKQNASIPTTMCWVLHLHPNWCNSLRLPNITGFYQCAFSPTDQLPMLVLSKEKDLTCRRLKQKAYGRDGFQFVSAAPPPPHGTHNGVWMCV